MFSKFVNRRGELRTLEREWQRLPSFVVIYGRRRVGKTRLLMEFSKGKRVLFHIFIQSGRRDLIRDVARSLGVEGAETWRGLFELLSSKIREKTLIVLDEFTYAVSSDPAILSELQRAWDLLLSRKDVMLVVSGSMMGMMEERVLASSSPLYGRRTRSMKIAPLGLWDSLEFFADKNYGLQSYMLLGGIPYYLIIASKRSDIKELVEEEFLRPNGFFYDEARILLSMELRDLSTYFSILSAISSGATRPTEIANKVGIETKKIYPYLKRLEMLDIVRREESILGGGGRGVYRIRDPFLLSWFSIVRPRISEIEAEATGFKDVKDGVNRVLGFRFEEVAREFLTLMNKKRELPFIARKIGRCWHRGSEIDLVALGRKNALFFEVKWSDLRVSEAKRILRKLEEKSQEGVFERYRKHYGLIAKSIASKKEFMNLGYFVYDIEDLLCAPS